MCEEHEKIAKLIDAGKRDILKFRPEDARLKLREAESLLKACGKADSKEHKSLLKDVYIYLFAALGGLGKYTDAENVLSKNLLPQFKTA